jgi:hypothetical protein
MSVITGFRYEGVSSNAVSTDSAVQVICFKPSGLEGSLLGVVPFFYSGNKFHCWDGR